MLKYVQYTELPVTDQDRAIRFYTEKLGLEVAQDSPYEEGWRWVSFAMPGADTKLLLSRRPDEEEGHVPVVVFIVDDVRESYEELKGRGINFVQEPAEASWKEGELYALFRDSEGNIIMLGTD